MIERIKVPAYDCTCDVCGYRWVSTGIEEPRECQRKSCRSKGWNGYKKPSHVKEIKMPSPRKRGRRRTVGLIDISDN